MESYGHSLAVVAGSPSRQQGLRGDAVSAFRWLNTRKTRVLTFRGHSVRHVGARQIWKNADAVVVELASGSLDAHVASIAHARRPLLVWGHVSNYVDRGNLLDRWLETRLMRRSDIVFAYTQGGKRAAVERGIPAQRVVALTNTVDTEAEVAGLESVAGASTEVGDSTLPTFAYIGGLDEDKRVDFLADVLDELWTCAPHIRFEVGGRGADEWRLRAAAERGQVTLHGHVGIDQKIRIAAKSWALVNPGRVGLIAVESFALRLPLITTDFPFHAPEFEYLAPGEDSLVVPGSAAEFARALAELSADPSRVNALRAAAAAKADQFTMEAMVQRFVGGILSVL
ncbi:glycosyltransferase family 4 protein [Cnuibacter physcomitrellae]|uniref:glycosyltransferase family 4 protein n=1 Tax=Cnuibacter physcomitrellae TaxID=1619308 RepID=UPI00217611E3|nr:glycosyltransferase family 4 protein [Cnuibacter physcomitrellae]MCS5496117.1 glycosyltransferase family 4 protein [Cnuibacter physcomitrellae]